MEAIESGMSQKAAAAAFCVAPATAHRWWHRRRRASEVNERDIRRYRVRLASLDAEREKFLEAFYADALPLDLLKAEQQRIETEMDSVRTQLDRAEADIAELAETFNQALVAARRMERTYREADDLTCC